MTPLLSHMTPLLSHMTPLLSHMTPLLSHMTPLLSHMTPLLSHKTPLLSHRLSPLSNMLLQLLNHRVLPLSHITPTFGHSLFITQPQAFTYQPQAFMTQTQTFNTHLQDPSSQPQAFATPSHDFSIQPHELTTQSHDSTTKSQTFSTEPQTFTTQPQDFTPQSQDSTTQPLTFKTWSQDSTTEVQTFTIQPQAFNFQEHGFSTQPQAFSADQQTCTIRSSGKKTILGEPNIQKVEVTDLNIVSKIAEGGFGEVFQGEWLETNVAIKKVKVKRMRLVKETVLQEVSVHSEIRHPNIVLLMGYALDFDHLFLISECVTGYNLDEVLFGNKLSRGTLTTPLKVSIAQNISQAVAYLHNRLPVIIHRDIKPENVLLSPDLKIVKLCDMGLSKLQSLNTMVTTMGDRKGVKPAGTPMYQAPEILLHHKKANKESDVWSLSCTLGELFSEAVIWNLEYTSMGYSGEDCEDSVERLRMFMTAKTRPHGVDQLSNLLIPSALISMIIKGLDYDVNVRPSVFEITRALKE